MAATTEQLRERRAGREAAVIAADELYQCGTDYARAYVEELVRLSPKAWIIKAMEDKARE